MDYNLIKAQFARCTQEDRLRCGFARRRSEVRCAIRSRCHLSTINRLLCLCQRTPKCGIKSRNFDFILYLAVDVEKVSAAGLQKMGILPSNGRRLSTNSRKSRSEE